MKFIMMKNLIAVLFASLLSIGVYAQEKVAKIEFKTKKLFIWLKRVASLRSGVAWDTAKLLILIYSGLRKSGYVGCLFSATEIDKITWNFLLEWYFLGIFSPLFFTIKWRVMVSLGEISFFSLCLFSRRRCSAEESPDEIWASTCL